MQIAFVIHKIIRENRAFLSSVSQWMDSVELDAPWTFLSFPTTPFILIPLSPLSTSKIKHFFGEVFARLTFIELVMILEIRRNTPSRFSTTPRLKNFVVVIVKKCPVWDFPGSQVVKNPPSNARDTGSIPVGELRSHMPRGNQVCAPQLLAHALWSPHATTREKSAHCNEDTTEPKLKKKKKCPVSQLLFRWWWCRGSEKT